MISDNIQQPTHPSFKFRNGRFLGISWHPAQSLQAEQIRKKLAQQGWRIENGQSWLIAHEKLADYGTKHDIITVTGGPRLFSRQSSSLLSAQSIANQLAHEEHDAVINALRAPFRLIWLNRSQRTINAATDIVGLAPVFLYTSDGLSIASSSVMLLKQIIPLTIDLKAVAAFSLFGSFPFSDSPYSEVRKVTNGTHICMFEGKVTSYRRSLPSHNNLSIKDTFIAAVDSMASAAPEAAIEVSGGLDSRLIIAALPVHERKRRTGHTLNGLNQIDSRDTIVAREVAKIAELIEHSVLSVSNISDAALYEIFKKTIIGYDGMANPIDKFSLVLMATHKHSEHFNGQNGEILRGFYYPLQAIESQASDTMI